MSTASKSSSPIVIVLASGRGERFTAAGGIGHKLQAPLAGSTVLAHTLAAVRASGLPWHLEDVGHPGMGDSIAAAVRATANAGGWLILPADLPLVQPATLQAVARVLAGPAQAAQPHYRGGRGHPVGFAANCGPQLAALSGNQGAAPILRALRDAQQVVEVEVDDVGIVTDIDTPEELARAEALMLERLSRA
ncbi:NTP transferase domain-containing protein [Variovorax sp. J2P1-59]|uniref:nucleotidyltransferase family protein n=1 Tax=Variovorax flavidus TaxID=3053501 RepID=UPI00257583F4|nr:NTP transferase domain-containing protein [Variovorax sp. J2P1-59]MDM0074436.1 NTP transferase domain-containing protein [Variovorax sp. J2P1-59]